MDNILQRKEISIVDSKRKRVEQELIEEITCEQINLNHGLTLQNRPKNGIEAGPVE